MYSLFGIGAGDLSKGQKAMALAMIYPNPERGRGKKDLARKETETGSFSYTRVKDARAVLRHSRALAEDVLKDITPLDAAHRYQILVATGPLHLSQRGFRRCARTFGAGVK
jgi:hypothetical protein